MKKFVKALGFLSNKVAVIVGASVIAFLLFLSNVMSWGDSFSFTAFVGLLIELGLLAIIIVGVILKKNNVILISGSGLLFYFSFLQFLTSGGALKSCMDNQIGGKFAAYAVFSFLAAICLLASFAMLVTKGFATKDATVFSFLNVIFCLAGFLFAFISFIMYLTLGEHSASQVMSELIFVLVPLFDVIVWYNLD